MTGLVSQEGATLPTQTWSFRTDTTADSALADTIHGNVLPATEGSDENDAIEVGTVFTPTVDGTVSAIRFFKGVQNTGTHVGTLWTAAGVPLGTVTFQNETPSGWQRATLPEPVPVTAGTAYVVSYYAPNGHYAATPGFFNEPRTSGDLTTPAGAARFRYGTGGGFPTGSFGSPSYFVDVELGGSTPLGIAGRTPAPDATGVDAGTTVSVTFSEAIGTGHTLALSVGGTPVAGSQALSGDRRTLTFTPSAALPLDRDVQADLTGVVAQDDGQALGSRTWSFRTRRPGGDDAGVAQPAGGRDRASRGRRRSRRRFSQPAASRLVPRGHRSERRRRRRRALLSADGKTVTFTPSAQLAASTTLHRDALRRGLDRGCGARHHGVVVHDAGTSADHHHLAEPCAWRDEREPVGAGHRDVLGADRQRLRDDVARRHHHRRRHRGQVRRPADADVHARPG